MERSFKYDLCMNGLTDLTKLVGESKLILMRGGGL